MWTITEICVYILGITGRLPSYFSHSYAVFFMFSAVNGFENSADCLRFGFVAMEVIEAGGARFENRRPPDGKRRAE